MRKPWWLRLVGVAVFLLLLALIGSWFLPPSSLDRTQLIESQFVLVFITFVLSVVWALASAVLWAIRKNARAQAAVSRDVISDTIKKLRPEPVRAAASPGTEPWDNPSTKIKCDGCGRYHALLLCRAHNLFMCFPCVARHDTNACFYGAAGRWVNADHKQPATSERVGGVLFR